jgi:hypothetical protein
VEAFRFHRCRPPVITIRGPHTRGFIITRRDDPRSVGRERCACEAVGVSSARVWDAENGLAEKDRLRPCRSVTRKWRLRILTNLGKPTKPSSQPRTISRPSSRQGWPKTSTQTSATASCMMEKPAPAGS